MFNFHLRRFDNTLDFFVVKSNFSCAGKDYAVGEKFDKESIPTQRLKKLFEFRKIAPLLDLKEKVVSAKQETPKTASVEIKESSGPSKWYSVFVDGEKIGKSFRDKKDAEKLASQYV